jgi:hypothetical protein
MDLYSFSNRPELILYYNKKEYIKKNIALSSPEKAYHYALDFLLDESIDCEDSNYFYSFKVYNFRKYFQNGEKIISTSAEYSYLYARFFLKGRFELGENAIATNALFSLNYAKYVLQDRFELAEPVILSSRYKEEYESLFLNE